MSPIVCVTALVTDRDHTDPEARVLLIKSAKPGRGVELPGGRVLNEESTVNAIYREVREETGLAMTHVAHFKNIVGTPKPGAEFGSNISIWEARAEGDPVAGDDAKRAFWASRQDVRELHRHGLLSDLDSRPVLLEWAGERLDETLAEAREVTNLVSDLRRAETAAAAWKTLLCSSTGLMRSRVEEQACAARARDTLRAIGIDPDAEISAMAREETPFAIDARNADNARPCEHCGEMAPTGQRFCSLMCQECEHTDHDATRADCAGVCMGRPAPLTGEDAAEPCRTCQGSGVAILTAEEEAEIIAGAPAHIWPTAPAPLTEEEVETLIFALRSRPPFDGDGDLLRKLRAMKRASRAAIPPEPSAPLTEEEARAQWIRGYAAAVAAMVRWQGVTPEDALRDAGLTVADLRGAKVFDHDIDVIVAKLSKGFISRGAIPPEVRHGSTPKAQAMFAKIIALNGRGPNVPHEWTTHDGLPVCSRCGVVRRADRDTTCKGSLPEVQQRTIPPEVRPAPEERRAPVQADHRRDPAKRRPAGTIAWSEHRAAWDEYAYRYGTEQSAERIAERGGFGYWELISLLGHEPRTWRAIGAPALAAQADLPRVLTSDEAHAAMPTGEMAVTDGEEK